MLAITVGIAIFLGSSWAVFSKRVDDGFIGRHLLTFIAISGAGYAYSGELTAILTAYVLFILFGLWLPLRKVLRMSHADMG